MISSLLALALATTTAQASDTTRAAREAFATCLRGYVDRSLEGGTTAEAFAAAYPQQCAAQESALREAVIRREISGRMSRADAEEAASMEVEDSRLNFSEYFAMSMPPTETAAAPAEAAAATTETAAATTETAATPPPE
jgi:hypothetical protein